MDAALRFVALLPRGAANAKTYTMLVGACTSDSDVSTVMVSVHDLDTISTLKLATGTD